MFGWGIVFASSTHAAKSIIKFENRRVQRRFLISSNNSKTSSTCFLFLCSAKTREVDEPSPIFPRLIQSHAMENGSLTAVARERLIRLVILFIIFRRNQRLLEPFPSEQSNSCFSNSTNKEFGRALSFPSIHS